MSLFFVHLFAVCVCVCVCVSSLPDNRYFISQVATTIIAIEDKSLEMYSGDYKYYMDNRPEIKEKVQSRFVSGDGRKMGNARVVEVVEEKEKKKKNFGGGGGPSGKKDKGVKNAKRMK